MNLKHIRVFFYGLIFLVFAVVVHTERIAGESEQYVVIAGTPEPIETIIAEEELLMSDEDISLIALVTMAEAEGESELGKRLVIDTILNRVDHPRWPSTVQEVIYQKNQFTSVWNGRINRCFVREDIYELVKDELKCRTNNECVFFNSGRYSIDGTPLLQEGKHYFSSC